MRTAETVLNIIRDRGRQGRPLERLYRHLYNRDLYLSSFKEPLEAYVASASDAMAAAKLSR